jgi:uncharacterized RDD family membrane protein YckC
MTADAPKGERRHPPPDDRPRADDAALGLVVATARLALSGARLLARTPGVSGIVERSAEAGQAARVEGARRIESVAQTALTGPEVGRIVDDAIAGPLPEALVRSSVDHQVVDRLAAELESELDRLTQQLLDSPEFERALERILSSPAVRDALTRQTTGFAEETLDRLRRRAAGGDAKLTLGSAREATSYGGAVTRSIAFAIDLVVAHLLFLVGASVVGIVVSIVGTLRPEWLFGALAGAAWLLWVAAYFVFFWTLGGQTLGMRALHLRVTTSSGDPPGIVRAIVRFVVLILSIIPMFLGFAPILFDGRRRGVPDLVTGTTVNFAD